MLENFCANICDKSGNHVQKWVPNLLHNHSFIVIIKSIFKNEQTTKENNCQYMSITTSKESKLKINFFENWDAKQNKNLTVDPCLQKILCIGYLELYSHQQYPQVQLKLEKYN